MKVINFSVSSEVTEEFSSLTVFDRVMLAKSTNELKVLDQAKKDEHDLVREAYASNKNISKAELARAFLLKDTALVIGASSNENASSSQLIEVLKTGHQLARLKASCNIGNGYTEDVFIAATARHQNYSAVSTALTNPRITEKMLENFIPELEYWNSGLDIIIASSLSTTDKSFLKLLELAKDSKVITAIAENVNAGEAVLLKILGSYSEDIKRSVASNKGATYNVLLQALNTNISNVQYKVAANTSAGKVLSVIFDKVNNAYVYNTTVRFFAIINEGASEDTVALALEDPESRDSAIRHKNINSDVLKTLLADPLTKFLATGNKKCSSEEVDKLIDFNDAENLTHSTLIALHVSSSTELLTKLYSFTKDKKIRVTIADKAKEESLQLIVATRIDKENAYDYISRISSLLDNTNITENIINSILDNNDELKLNFIEKIIRREASSTTLLLKVIDILKNSDPTNIVYTNLFSVISPIVINHPNANAEVISNYLDLKMSREQMTTAYRIAFNSIKSTDEILTHILSQRVVISEITNKFISVSIIDSLPIYVCLSAVDVDIISFRKLKEFAKFKIGTSVDRSATTYSEYVAKSTKSSEAQLCKLAEDENYNECEKVLNNSSCTEKVFKAALKNPYDHYKYDKVVCSKAITFAALKSVFENDSQSEIVRLEAIENTFMDCEEIISLALADTSYDVRNAAVKRMLAKSKSSFNNQYKLITGDDKSIKIMMLKQIKNIDLLVLAIALKDEDKEIVDVASTHLTRLGLN